MLLACVSAAGMNTIAKLIYERGEVSQASLIFFRCVVVYVLNALVTAARSGRTLALWVITLRVESSVVARLALCRGAVGASAVYLFHLSFQLTSLADAIAIAMALEVVSTVLLARLCIQSGERLTTAYVAGGATALFGVLLVTQPAFIFGGETPSPAGSLLAIAGGLIYSLFNLLSRVLGRAPPSEGGHQSACGALKLGAPVSPAALTAYLMVVTALFSVGVQCAALATGAAPAWATFRFEPSYISSLLLLLYSSLVLTFQLLCAAAYGLMPAGQAAILSLSELGFTALFDVFVLHEPTEPLAAIGMLTIFTGCAISTDSGDGDRGGRMSTQKRTRVRSGSMPERESAPLGSAPLEVDLEDWLPASEQIRVSPHTGSSAVRVAPVAQSTT